ncbi:MAG: DUF1254 domain-containing protein [Phenylobacterium sp.]|uniref:DUF1254 domain-containing protein n=1 Tax=Phenylobacterium sp. TaxID=1871053 RepID=UPI00301B5879
MTRNLPPSTQRREVLGLAASALALSLAPGAVSAASALTPAEAKAIAKEAWAWSYAPIEGYQTLYAQAVNKDAPGYVGGFNQFRHYSRLATPADKDIVTPNNDTPYSWAWLDLRAEPIVLSLPAVPKRYYVNQWFDLYTHNFAYTGTRTTGREAGNYLFAGPRWKGTVPKGIKAVFRAETEIVGTLTRTSIEGGAEDIPALQAVQAQYRLTPLSKFTGRKAPPAGPPVNWTPFDRAKAEGLGFIPYINALLPLMPTVPSEVDMRARFARIGVAPGRVFNPATLDPAIRKAMEEGVAEAAAELKAKALTEKSSADLFGTREFLGADYVYRRNVGAMLGIYGNSKDEALYGSQQTDKAGKVLDGSRNWLLRFEPGQLPPVNEFWSITMYGLPERFLVANPINRYSIGDRTPGLKLGADGSLEIYLQSESPGKDRESNWLPTPKGPFFFVGRFYGPKANALRGEWSLPPLIER